MEYNKREWQLFEVSILDKVVAICEKYNIRYFLSSGTLIGAVRHKGFIPWDDDIDIDMPIKDYKKFCKVAPKELEKVGCFFQTYKTDPETYIMWGMVRANNTTSMPISSYNWNIHWGVHIDIFPIIGLYENKFLRNLQNKLFDLNKTLLEKDYIESGSCKDYTPNKKVQFLYKFPRCIRHLIVKVNNKFIDKNFDKSTECAQKWSSLFSGYKREYFDNTIQVEYEGKLYKGPIGYNELLTNMYGDYMTPPPEEERQGHEMLQGETIRDLHTDYRVYQEKLRKKKYN